MVPVVACCDSVGTIWRGRRGGAIRAIGSHQLRGLPGSDQQLAYARPTAYEDLWFAS